MTEVCVCVGGGRAWGGGAITEGLNHNYLMADWPTTGPEEHVQLAFMHGLCECMGRVVCVGWVAGWRGLW